jgi:RNA polymerase sigma factor (sigma-70 family)
LTHYQERSIDMATAGLGRVLDHLRKVLPASGELGVLDGELLARFAAARDEAAFAALVARHGSLVLGVCRRLLRHEQDAEDAFQTTFLVLASKAAALGSPQTVAPWLHEVAWRTSLEVRKAAIRRCGRERPLEELREPAVPPAEPQDWRALLDKELRALPAKYRAAVVLCELEGRPRQEAARMLGIAEGTLSWRLAAARKRLAGRLARRGVVLGAVLAVAEAVSPPLAASTVEAALLVPVVQAGAELSAVLVMKGILKMIVLGKVKLAATGVLALALGASAVVYQTGRPTTAVAEELPSRANDERAELRRENALLKLNLRLALERVRALEAEVRALKRPARAAAGPNSNDAAHIAFLRLEAAYAEKLSAQGNNVQVAQKWWLMSLAELVVAYPRAEDTPEALLELGLTCEMLGKESEAERWYGSLAKSFPSTVQGRKGAGALLRLGLEGKPFRLVVPRLDNAGAPLDSAALKGKLVLVYYWASWCTSAAGDFARLKAILKAHAGEVELLCVNLDQSAEEARAFLARNAAPGRHAHQPDGFDSKAATKYGVMAIPHLFLVGRDGRCLLKCAQVGTVEEEIRKALKK